MKSRKQDSTEKRERDDGIVTREERQLEKGEWSRLGDMRVPDNTHPVNNACQYDGRQVSIMEERGNSLAHRHINLASGTGK